jgi:hypothetical protein
MKNLKKKEAVAIRNTDDDVDDIPFVPRKKPSAPKDHLTAYIAIKEAPKEPNPVIADPGQERDWLLDPVNLYMRGMAQRREQMKKL